MMDTGKSAVAVFLLWGVLLITACTTEEIGFLAGDYCAPDGLIVCDANMLVVLECAGGIFQPKDDCGLRGQTCIEESGMAACTGTYPVDTDTADADMPALPENEAPVIDDTPLPENDIAPGDDSIVEPDEDTPGFDDPIDDPIDEDALPTDDATSIDEDTFMVDDHAPIDEDIPALDEDAVVTDTPVDEDLLITDEAPDSDTPVICTATLINDATLYGADTNSDGTTDLFFNEYTPTTGSASLPDQFKFWVTTDTYYDQTYTLGTGLNANTSSCEQCLFIGEDYDDGQQKFLKYYFASEGTMVVTETGGGCGSGGEVYLTLTNAKFIEITLDAGSVSTPVPGGACITMSGTQDLLLQ